MGAAVRRQEQETFRFDFCSSSLRLRMRIQTVEAPKYENA